nr:polyribonucleotide nucleotidyltransferase [Desulfobacterales bacterium]
MELRLKTEIDNRTLAISTGKLAKQANGAVVVQYGETMILVTAVAAEEIKEDIDFLPLTVEYQEKGYAAGRIPGNYFRREVGRPTEKETLTSRIIDRPIRPLFPKDYKYETQVIASVLSVDRDNDPDILAVIGASAALELSDIPFNGPIACIRVGRIDGKLKINPVQKEIERSDINLIVAGSRDSIVMVEGGGRFVKEAEMLDAIFFAHEQMQPIIDLQERLKEARGLEKRSIPRSETDERLVREVEDIAALSLTDALLIPEKIRRREALKAVKNEVMLKLGESYLDRKKEVSAIIQDLERKIVRNLALKEGKRIDGRGFTDIRPITAEVGLLPRTHGSGLFTRGETQALGIVTLGSPGDEQRIETLEGDIFKPFMLHYNFPPYSVREVRRPGGPGRREIGHGALAARAIQYVLPDCEAFSYTIRIVSEILESNGSSSMATVCASSLALMDAGVPISGAVAGIAMGLIKEGEDVIILSDILGDEDHMGDMDFKVAGTREGITAVQMDIKIDGITKDIMGKALEQAREGRHFILDKMAKTIDRPRKELSPYAPKIISLQIKPEKIRDLIGPGGKVIRSIQLETDTRIDVDEAGTVKITATNEEMANKAFHMIEDIIQEVEIGGIYEGTVRKIMDFGAFVEIFPGTDGLIHISQLDFKRVRKVSDILREGDKVKVKVLEINRDGKISLSRKAAMIEEKKRNKL